jgi:hypothetical protein
MVHSIEVVKSPVREPPAPPGPLFHWFMMEYLPDRSIDLTLVHMSLKDEGVCGWMMRESDYEFIIQIEETLEGNEYTRTLLHELYHCLQHLKGIPRCEMCAKLSEEQNLDRYTKGL